MNLNDERLSKLPFLDYLKEMHSRIKGIRHTNKSNSAYSEARELSHHIINRYIKEYNLTWENYNSQPAGQHLRLSAQKLELYNHKASDKRKGEVIAEFVREFEYDLMNMIRARERNKENPSTPIEDEPI